MTTQHEINRIWEAEWKKGGGIAQIFGNRLFLEGYPVVSRHIPRGARTILDVGAGTGRYGLSFARALPESHVTLTDISPTALSEISRFASELRLRNVTVKEEDALHLTFPDATFDFVFCDVVIQHIPKYAHAFSEMARVLRPGGTLIVSVNNVWNIPHMAYKLLHRVFGISYRYGYEHAFSRAELVHLAKTNNLRVEALDGFYFAYGVYRWKEHARIFKFIGGALNRLTRGIDQITGRAFSRYFGFEIFIVTTKPKD